MEAFLEKLQEFYEILKAFLAKLAEILVWIKGEPATEADETTGV